MKYRRHYNRRQIVKGMVASAVAAPWLVPGRALGLAGKAAASQRVAVGHIGVGNRGSSLFRSFMSLADCQIVATADCYQNRRERMASICQGQAYQDFRQLLARDDIDAVIIATPDHWHVPIGMMAARAKKDVYIEKPLGVTIEQDLAMQKAIADHQRIFQYGTQQRSMPHCWRGCELVRRGAIGEVHTIEVDAPNGGRGGTTQKAPIPEGFDFEMWCGPSPLRAYTPDLCKPNGTYWVYDYSIGYLGGWGAHPLDIMVWACDADTTGLVTVEGTGDIPAEGLYDCVYNWDMTLMLDDVKLVFRPGADRTKFIGEDGWIEVARNQGRNGASDPALHPVNPTKPVEPIEGSLPVSTNHSADFIQAVKTRTQPVSNITDAVRSDLISLLCDMAVRTGEKITWDAQRNQLIDPSAKASAMLTRKMRSPWTL